MSDIVNKVEAERNIIEKIVSYIPGYHGYKEKEIRRESDRLVRQKAADNLKRSSDNFKRSLSSSISLPDVNRITADRVIARLDLLKERIAKAEGGYAGFFDSVKVREKRLDKMIESDLDLINQSSVLSNKFEQIVRDGVIDPVWTQNISEIEVQINRIENLLRRREEILSQP